MDVQVKRENKPSALRTQLDVLVSLTILAMHTQQGKYRFGYAWSLFEPVLLILVLTVAHLVIRLMSPLDMAPMTFMVLGCVPFYLFRKTMTTCFKAITARRVLLGLGRVTPLDILVSSALTELVTYSLVFLGFMIIAVLIEHSFPPRVPLGVLAMFLAASLYGCAVGLVFAAIFRYFKPIDKFMSIINRVGMWTSGAFFVLLQVPPTAWPYLDWNPILHINELIRQYWFSTYQSPVASPLFVFECLVALFALGLLLERRIREVPIQ